MKKFLAILLAGVLALSLVACGGNKSQDPRSLWYSLCQYDLQQSKHRRRRVQGRVI